MEDHDPLEMIRAKTKRALERYRERIIPGETSLSTLPERPEEIKAVVERHQQEKARRQVRQKWTGRVLMFGGFLTLWGSCGLYTFSLMGFQTRPLESILVSLALIGAGYALTAWRPRLKDTNEALLVAAKYGNRLTSARLALELDISFEKAEKIIGELVRSGVAEIDLEHNDPEQPITYKVRGI
ncbi:MAG: hypothetical protein HY914_13565 [Desulfomonile tiedjei]|nr:hypothetical protein [Desulfomonile tiedjei]